MLVSVEQFNNGNTYTVVYSDIVYTEMKAKDWKGGFIGLDLDSGAIRGYCKGGELYWTALPPLPRNPTADDAKLISLYRAHGFYICATENYSEPIENRNPFIIVGSNNDGCFYYQEIINKEEDGWLDPSIITITHALDEQGNRIEIALKD